MFSHYSNHSDRGNYFSNSKRLLILSDEEENLLGEDAKRGTCASVIRKLQNNTNLSALKSKLNNPIARATLCEATYAFGFSGATYYFLDKSNVTWTNNPFTSSSGFLTGNLFLRILSKYLNCNSDLIKDILNSIFNHVRGSLFALIDHGVRNTLMHEGGHVLAGELLYQSSPNVTLTWDGFVSSGVTYHNNFDGFTPLGEKIGEQTSAALISGAGAAMTMLSGFAMLAAAQILSNEYPEVKRHLRYTVFINILSLLLYALSPLDSCEAGNDFCALESHGVTPVESISVILGSILLFQLMLSGISKCAQHVRNRRNTYNEECRVEEIKQEEEEDFDSPLLKDDIGNKSKEKKSLLAKPFRFLSNSLPKLNSNDLNIQSSNLDIDSNIEYSMP